MAKCNEFKALFIKYMIKDPTISNTTIIERISDIPADCTCYKRVVLGAYALLCNYSSSELREYKMLSQYQHFMEENIKKMRTSKLDFAFILYLLHHIAIRVVKSPWRKDYLTLKTYNGFFMHTIGKNLDNPAIQELLQRIGFRYNRKSRAYEFGVVKIDPQAKEYLTNKGIDLFLSYVHCRMRFDSKFMSEIKKYQTELSRVDSGDRIGDEDYESRNIVSRPPSSWSSASRTIAQEAPLDLSLNLPPTRTPKESQAYSHKKIFPKSSRDRQASQPVERRQRHRDYVDDRELYDHPEQGTRDGSIYSQSSESFDNGQVLYPPGDNFPLKASPPNARKYRDDKDMSSPLAEKGLVPSSEISPYSPLERLQMEDDKNYVIFTSSTQRGTPDGEINKQEYVDSAYASDPTFRAESKSAARRAVRSQPRHDYHEINDHYDDKDLY